MEHLLQLKVLPCTRNAGSSSVSMGTPLLTHVQRWRDPQTYLHSAAFAMCQWLLPVPPQALKEHKESQASKKRERGKVSLIFRAALCFAQWHRGLVPHKCGTRSGYVFAQVNLGELHTSTCPESPEITWDHITRLALGGKTPHQTWMLKDWFSCT